MAPVLPFTRPAPVEVFAVSDTAAQLTWRRLSEGHLEAVVDGAVSSLGNGAGPGAADIVSLPADSAHHVELTVDGRRVAQTRVHTQPCLAGDPVVRVATIGDLHLGETGFGLVKQMRHPRGESIPLRCARAAVAEAYAWGAELLVVKGDITADSRAQEWELFDELLADIDIPVIAVPGNHDVASGPGALDGAEELRRRGLFEHPVQHRDYNGVRIVAVDSTIPGHSWGRIGPRLGEICAAIDTGRPVLVFTHHHFQERAVPRFWPLGVPRNEGAQVLDKLTQVNPNLVISSGHTHRNRVRLHGTALVGEVSSTKDYPGVWAGYAVHVDGVRQVVRRITDPACVAWNDRSAAAVAGIWGRWTPGSLQDRSRLHRWVEAPDRRRAPRAAKAPELISRRYQPSIISRR